MNRQFGKFSVDFEFAIVGDRARVTDPETGSVMMELSVRDDGSMYPAVTYSDSLAQLVHMALELAQE